jgi:predicted RNase H-like HicB family nuclease
MRDYHINVFYSEDAGCFVADIPDLRFCSACGASPEEAVREVLQAKGVWLKVAKQASKPIPRPK